jgi:U3 small nucleolar RNA-associated protein 12
MMKSYMRYEPDRSFGVIASVQSNISYDWSGNLLLSGSGESVSVWNVRQGAQISTLSNEVQGYPYSLPGEVNFIVYSPDKVNIAAGYSTGEICIFQYLKSTTKTATLRGHQTAISCLAYDQTGTLLASGGRDSDIVIWDAVSCTGQCRLRGHKDAVTGVAFISRGGGLSGSSGQQLVVSVSKDTLLKVWDVSTQHCIQTIVGHRSEIWSLAVHYPVLELTSSDADAAEKGDGSNEKSKTNYNIPTIMTGATDDLLRAYTINRGDVLLGDSEAVLEYAGCVKLSGGERCTHIEFNSHGTILAAQTGQKNIEIFRFRTASEAKNKLKRRLKRLREKATKAAEQGEAGGGTGSNDLFAAAAAGGDAEEAAAGAGAGAASESITLSDCLDSFSVIRCPHKVKSFSISRAAKHSKVRSSAAEESLALSMTNNMLEFYSITPPSDETKEGAGGSAKKSVIEMSGHRSDVRCVALSSDGLQIASSSSDGVRVWSSVTFQCLRRCPTGYGVSLVFAPGGRYVILGTREGRLQVGFCVICYAMMCCDMMCYAML